MSETVPDDVVEIISQFIEEQHGYLSWLDVTVHEYSYDRITLSVPFQDKLTNPTTPPTMHGGVAATLIDTAGGLVLRPHLDNPIEGGVATINLNVNFLRRINGDLTARAEIVRAGSNIGFSRVTVECDTETETDDQTLVAEGEGSYRMFHG